MGNYLNSKENRYESKDELSLCNLFQMVVPLDQKICWMVKHISNPIILYLALEFTLAFRTRWITRLNIFEKAGSVDWSNKHVKNILISICAIPSLTVLYYKLTKDPKTNNVLTLEEALKILEMKDISQFTKKSFNWTYLCKKKQFTTGKSSGNSLVGHFYEEKLRRLEEARVFIEKEIKKKEGVLEEKEILVGK